MVVSFRVVPERVALSLEKLYPPLLETPTNIHTVIVLGGGINSDPNLPLTSKLTAASLIRLTEGITQLNHLDSARLIVTGGKVLDTVSIASIMKIVAINLGVEESRIYCADSALNTEMEARFVREMVAEDSVILVTSATHMNRAISLFKKVGFDPIAAPTSHLIYDTPFNAVKLFPSSWNIFIFRVSIHEYFGYIWSKIRGRI
jgi:uncharacterized SAM-binding protein YcdF (DUF218 family)